MKEYLKMADYIVGDVSMSVNHNGDVSVSYDYADPDMIVRKTMDAMEHAINSHDELVENMQYYKCEAEKLELRAIKEASGAQDLQSEVDRLRDVIESVISTSEALALKSPTSDWGDGFKECALTTANALKNIIDIHHK